MDCSRVEIWSNWARASAGMESTSGTAPTSITFCLDCPALANTVPKMTMKNSGKNSVKNRLIRSRTKPLNMATARLLNALILASRPHVEDRTA